MSDLQFRIVRYDSVSVGRDGVVRHVHEDAGGREEWSEPLCDSPVCAALPGWVWDLTMDPRGQSGSELL